MLGLLDFVSLRDMIDGGGAGRAGDAFEGGPLSGFLNELGIRPRGYFDRQREMRAAPPVMSTRSPAAAPATPPMAPPPNPYAPGAITQTTLPPMGQMPNDELVRLILQALRAAPPATGYGPR